LCLAVYGEDDFFMGSCWDPKKEDGRYNATDGCVEGLHCWHQQDGQQSCHNGTVCTCDKDLCNSRNASSTLPTESTPTTLKTTMRCWFGEKHPSTGTEDWKMEECESNEHYCFQLVHGEGESRFEVRQCWDLAYEEGRYSGAGCYKGQNCHHQHCFNDTTVCICKEPECNDWSAEGNVTTVVPVTDGSDLLCYSGDDKNYEAKPCARSETMCMGFSTPLGTILDCYDPKSNDETYISEGCWNGVDIEQTQDTTKGKLCLCSSGQLCNKEFLGTSGAVMAVLSPLLPLLSVILFDRFLLR